MKIIGIAVLLMGLTSIAFAGIHTVPEIGPASGVATLAVISGAILVIRGRRKR